MSKKEITEKELQVFFEVIEKHNIPYNKTPRTKEDIENLNCIYNKNDKTIYFKEKTISLLENEIIVTPKELFDIIMTNTSNSLNEELIN